MTEISSALEAMRYRPRATALRTRCRPSDVHTVGVRTGRSRQTRVPNHCRSPRFRVMARPDWWTGLVIAINDLLIGRAPMDR
jgi:hypothetical protein